MSRKHDPPPPSGLAGGGGPGDSRQMTRFPAIILSGGRASRMGGGDKTLLRIGGRSLLQHIVTRLSGQCGQLALSANGDPARFAAFGLPVLADDLPDQPGPLAGLLAGLDWAAGLGASRVVTIAGDTPFPPSDLTAKLVLAAGPRGLALAAGKDPDGTIRQHPTTGLWPVVLREDLRATLASGQRRVRDFAGRHRPGLAIWEIGETDPFFNINTPEDLRRAEFLVSGLRD